MTGVVHVAFLLAIWLALWGDLTVANVVSGVLVSVAVTFVAGTRHRGHFVFRPVRVLVFATYFLAQLVIATIEVAIAILRPRPSLRSGIVAVRLRGWSDTEVTLIADAISLTPGTITIEVREDPPTLYVHVLDLADPARIERDVRRLETLAVRAFGSDEARAALTRDDAVESVDGIP